MDYSSQLPDRTQYIYVFGQSTVNVFAQVGPDGRTPPRKPDGSLDAMAPLVRIPILENAPYTIDGSTLTIDWTRNHTTFQPLAGSTKASESFTIENGGHYLRSIANRDFIVSEQT